ncbi:hypothetical protein J1614_009382 [Plenodomus biglobosus]|nr:hypothetical protein J1614_009382 [Plenodomus biglobosus]
MPPSETAEGPLPTEDNVGPALPCLTITPGKALSLAQSLKLCSDPFSNCPLHGAVCTYEAQFPKP